MVIDGINARDTAQQWVYGGKADRFRNSEGMGRGNWADSLTSTGKVTD